MNVPNKKNSNKFKLIALVGFCFTTSLLFSQAELINGPALSNDRDSRMNRLLKGDADHFYAYRVRSRGRGTSFYVEKYAKQSLKPVFSKEISLNFEADTKIIDVEYSSGNVFIFRSQYDSKTDVLSVFFQTVSSNGNFAENLKEISSISTKRNRFSSVHVYPNPSQTKFLIQISYKQDKDEPYKTDFILMDAVNQKKLWTKTVSEKMVTNSEGKTNNYVSSGPYFATGRMVNLEDIGFIGLHLDDADNVYYAISAPAADWSNENERYKLSLNVLDAKKKEPRSVDVGFDASYFVSDVEFIKTKTNEIIIGGFIKTTEERRGRDLVKAGIFSYTFEIDKLTLRSKNVKLFDDAILTALESTGKRSRYFKYKLDYMMPIGEDIYFVGEQYNEELEVTGRGTMGTHGSISTTTDADWKYEYMDVIVAKLSKNGEFEWVKNLPLRQKVTMHYNPHVFKQYIAFATNNFIYMLCDDHPKNMERYVKPDYEPADLKTVSGIHGSNFVCNQLNISTGEIRRQVLMVNETYCFAPIQERNPDFIPPSDCEIFVPGAEKEIYIYTEDAGRDRFAKIKFD